MTMGVGKELLAISEESGCWLCVEILSFYLGGDGTYGIPGSDEGQTCRDGIPRNCQRWDILSTSPGIGNHGVFQSGDD